MELTNKETKYIFDTYGCEPKDLPYYEVEDAVLEFREVHEC